MRTSAYRLSLAYAGIFVGAVIALVLVIYLLTTRFIDEEVDTAIERDVAVLLEAFQQGGIRRLTDEMELRRDAWGRANAVYLLADAQGTVLSGNLSAWPLMRSTDGRWVEFEIVTRAAPRIELSHPVRAIIVPLPDDVRLLVGTDLSERRLLMRRFAVATVLGVALMVCLATIIGYRQNRLILERLSSITRSCAGILAGDLSQRLPVIGVRDEFDTLSQEFNELLDRLARTTEILRASLHSAAHDLRSPMHRMRLRLEQALAVGDETAPCGDMEALLQDIDHMQKVLTALLQIAEAESGAPGARPEPVAIDDMLHPLAELYHPQAEARHIVMETASEAALHVSGHRQLLAQAFANLIDNALKYTPSGGRVVIGAARRGDRVVVCVSDTGPGIPAADRQRVLEPFVRLGQGVMREGAGLGLSLAAAVARLHGGTLRLDDNAPGLRAELELPLAVTQ